MIKLGIFFASLDIKDAFYSTAIYKEHQVSKIFGQRKKKIINAMPNGFRDITRAFNKILEPP